MVNMELKELLCSLEERLVEHDNNRKEVQDHLQEISTKMVEEADLLEEKISEELQKSFVPIEERILSFIEKLDNNEGEPNETLVKQAQGELSIVIKYFIEYIKDTDSFLNSYNLKITEEKNDINNNDENSIKDIISQLREYLSKTHEFVTSAQNELTEICTKRRNKAEELKRRINDELEPLFSHEDSRIQEIVNLLKKNDNEDINNKEELIARSNPILLKSQKYSLKKNGRDDYKIVVTKDISLKIINFEERKPSSVVALFTGNGEISLSFSFFSDVEITVLKETDLKFIAEIKLWVKNDQNERDTKTITKKFNIEEPSICFVESLAENTVYCLKVRIRGGNFVTKWSDETELKTPDFKTYYGWKKCPDYVDNWNKYSVDENNSRIATNIIGRNCTITGNLFIPSNKVISWNIKILKTGNIDENDIFIGVAPFDIDQNAYFNYNNCGWYYNCCDSLLYSGFPHKYFEKSYGIMKLLRMLIHIGDMIGIVMNTIKGELSFIVNKVNYGVAYKGIPLDKPLVPCVLLRCDGSSAEIRDIDVLTIQEDNTISVPSNVTVKDANWKSITLAWDKVKKAEFYQVEIDSGKCYNLTTSNTFTVENLLPDAEYTFRVRSVKKTSMSVWSDAIKGRTMKIPDFSNCVWEKCPDNVDKNMKYSVDKKNPKIGIKIGVSYKDGTIIGNTPLSLNKITSWNIKILKSRDNDDGGGIYIGVAPFDINQLEKYNYEKCGWYFYCYDSTLCSGPPHNYDKKEYGPRKRWGEYVHTGDSVGVVMDTTNGELSFVLEGVNLGVAYKGIPLDKPLVPCVILWYGGDSVELDTTEVKETEVDPLISIPSNITLKNITWNSITLSWDLVEEASFYQIEVDGNKTWYASTTNRFTMSGLLEETEYNFKIRTVKDNKVSEWSGVVKGRTVKALDFTECIWKECPDDIDNKRKYSINSNNSRIATKINDGYYCTIIGNTPLPLNKVTSWNFKILKSQNNDGGAIFIGVAPFDINQYEEDNYEKCGWYFICYGSKLYSGPPHKYGGKEYGPRKDLGEYVHTGDSIGVVMDTLSGELSFVVSGVNLGIAYEEIPLDKPLIPCVQLHHKDSVELII